jgi:hypothetical protein
MPTAQKQADGAIQSDELPNPHFFPHLGLFLRFNNKIENYQVAVSNMIPNSDIGY